MFLTLFVIHCLLTGTIPVILNYCERLQTWDKRYEISFDIFGGKFLSSVGSSKELGELLSKYKPEEVGPMTRGDPNRIKELQKRLQEQVKQLKEAKEAKEANLPASK